MVNTFSNINKANNDYKKTTTYGIGQLEDTNMLLRSRKSKKSWKYNDTKKKDKRTHNDVKTLYRKLQTEQKQGINSCVPEG
jgi:uncharacterized protein YcbK (DUF882 family)